MERPWPDLPEELIQLIRKHLSFFDILRLRQTCRGWREALPGQAVPDGYRPETSMPWLMLFGEFCRGTIHAFFNPWKKEIYSVEIPILCQSRCLASAHGWLLVLSSSSSIFFLNPFTMARIDLPEVPSYVEAATFTAPPTSTDCIVFCIGCCSGHSDQSDINISVCRRGEDMWTYYTFDNYYPVHGKMFSSILQVVFCRGNFYCLDSLGKLGTFNIEDESWKFLPRIKLRNQGNIYLTVCDGAVYAAVGLRYGSDFEGLFKLMFTSPVMDNQSLDLRRVLRIPKWKMFFGPKNCCVSSASRGRITTPRKVYVSSFYPYSKCTIYDIYNCEEKEIILTCREYNGCYAPIWIEPRWIVPSSSMLQWAIWAWWGMPPKGFFSAAFEIALHCSPIFSS